MLTISEAAEYLNVSKSSLRRWSNENVLPSFRVGMRGERRFDIGDLDAFLVARGKAPKSSESMQRAEGSSPREILDACASHGTPRHVSLHFRDEQEQWRLLGPYLIGHMAEGASVLYMHDSSHRTEIIDRLRSEGIDVEEALRTRRLVLCPPQDCYLQDGYFAADRMLRFMRKQAATLLANPSGKAMITGEMTWFLTGAPGVEQVLAYERELNVLLQDFPHLTIVCQYHLKRLNSETTFGALLTHPFAHSVEGFRRGLYMDPLSAPANSV
ncbi:MEDS domain-containing protein [Methylohalobius crimeensis]|uniref:MEDS domain-containing protein n=1 Tax=Methylohalobius crimeensis TaxID=244365 RepID=UPI0003B47C59|nr:MEDS domain-containing protein [Methylohalobius crimeensis]